MIQFFDLQAQHRALGPQLEAAAARVIASGSLVLGEEARGLEAALAGRCERAHGVGVGSGSDALRLALTALGIGPGDEVILPSFTFVATAAAVARCGAVPVFADLGPEGFNVDPGAVASVLTERTQAIVAVHLFGQSAQIEALSALAAGAGVALVEDCAQAVGARAESGPVGGFGAASCLSFYPTKNLGGCGDGGMVLTDDPALAVRIDRLRRQGLDASGAADEVGFASRLDELQAALLTVKLAHLDTWNARRRAIAHRYTEGLAGLDLVLPEERTGTHHVFHLYTVRSDRREPLRQHLVASGVPTRAYYPIPIHRMPAFAASAAVSADSGGLPHTERAAAEVLSLPLYPELSDSAVEQVITAVRQFFGESTS